jgi:hypothetical protein
VVVVEFPLPVRVMVTLGSATPEGPAVVHWPTVPDMLKSGHGVGVGIGGVGSADAAVANRTAQIGINPVVSVEARSELFRRFFIGLLVCELASRTEARSTIHH